MWYVASIHEGFPYAAAISSKGYSKGYNAFVLKYRVGYGAIGSHGVANYGGGDVPRPSAVVMAYSAHADHASTEPPTFVVMGDRR